MEFRVLAVGDVVGAPGLRFLQQKLRGIKRLYGADFCVVNGENANVVGITPQQADAMLDAGADVITLGNHTWNRREILPYLDECGYILRPANFLPSLPGRGWGIFETKAGPVAVVNLIGRCSMDFGPDNPFRVIDKILRDIGDIPVLIDFHAEATSEKLAMGYYLDGKISALWGTHTHVPTADEQVLPNGTGYQTDLGTPKIIDELKGSAPAPTMIAVQKIFGLLSDTPGLSDIKLAQNDRQTIGKNIEQAL